MLVKLLLNSSLLLPGAYSTQRNCSLVAATWQPNLFSCFCYVLAPISVSWTPKKTSKFHPGLSCGINLKYSWQPVSILLKTTLIGTNTKGQLSLRQRTGKFENQTSFLLEKYFALSFNGIGSEFSLSISASFFREYTCLKPDTSFSFPLKRLLPLVQGLYFPWVYSKVHIMQRQLIPGMLLNREAIKHNFIAGLT